MGEAPKGAVLVIEDEPVLRMAALDMVEEAGFEPLAAIGADDAIRMLESRSDILLVFSDIDLARGTDGLKLAHMVRDRWPPIAIIITSGKHRPHSHQLPARSLFFEKPYQRTEVTQAMREMLAV